MKIKFLESDPNYCYVIAEAGLNHNGSMKLAKDLIQIAKNSGVDAVKFQKREVSKLAINKELDKMFLGNGTGAPNIGFGTPTPDGDLHIKKTGSVTLKLESDETDGTVYTRFLNDAIGWRLGIQSNDRFALYDSTNAVTHLIAENNSLRSLVGIGTTNPSNAVVLDVAGPMRLSGSMVQKFQALSTANLTYNGTTLSIGGTITSVTDITASGTIQGAEVTATSDERLKSDIQTIDNALDKVMSMRGVTYTMQAEKGTGVIAQEVEAVAPEIVVTRDDGYKAVNYQKLTALLIEAVKELKEEIKELKKDK